MTSFLKRSIFFTLVLFGVQGAFATQQISRGKEISCGQLASEAPLSHFDQIRSLRSQGKNLKVKKLQDEIENQLLNAPILGGMVRLPNGENNPHRINLGNGLFAVFKPVIPDRPFKMYGEAAAYRISKALKLDIVPPTVIREVDGVLGSVQLFVPNAHALVSDPKYPWYEKQTGRWMKVFDWLIKNHDRGRNLGNTLISELDGEIIGIDHGKIFVDQNLEARPGKISSYTEDDINDPELWRRVRTVTEKDLRNAMVTIDETPIVELLARFRILKAHFQTLFPE